MSTFIAISMGLLIFISTFMIAQNTIMATGGSATLAKAIQPLVQEAKEAAEQGDTEAVLELLEEINKEAKDSYEIKD